VDPKKLNYGVFALRIYVWLVNSFRGWALLKYGGVFRSTLRGAHLRFNRLFEQLTLHAQYLG